MRADVLVQPEEVRRVVLALERAEPVYLASPWAPHGLRLDIA
jgi:hypothetical protein